MAGSVLFFVIRSELVRQSLKILLYPVPKGNMRCANWKRILQVYEFSLIFCENRTKTPSSFVQCINLSLLPGLATFLGLSESAVSLALNNKPGVSSETRKRVFEAAKAQGYDFSRKGITRYIRKGTICFAIYKKAAPS